MKKLILGSVVTAALVFTGCGSDDNETTTPAGDTVKPVVSAAATGAIDTAIVLATDNTAVTSMRIGGADKGMFTLSGATATATTAGTYHITVTAKDAANNTSGEQAVVVTVTGGNSGSGDPTVRTAATPYIGSDVVELGGKKWLKLKGTSDGSDDITNTDGNVSLYSYRKTWTEAGTICGALTLDGASAGDWKVPTREDAKALIDNFTEQAADANGGIPFTGTLNTAVLGAGSDADAAGFWTSDDAQSAIGFYNHFYNADVNQPFSLTCVK